MKNINENSVKNIAVEMDYIEKRINRIKRQSNDLNLNLLGNSKLKKYKKLNKRLSELCSKLNDEVIDNI